MGVPAVFVLFLHKMRKETNGIMERFEPEIEACVAEVKERFPMIFTPLYRQFRRYCEKLFEYAAREQSDYLFALAYFYMMEYYASDNDCVNAISCGHEGIKYQLATQEYELVARTYNVLGVCNFVMGNFTKAVDYYLSSIDYSKEYRFAQIHGMAASNLADLFRYNNVYERAMFYYAEAEEYIIKSGEAETKETTFNNMNCMLCNKGYCLLNIGKIDEATECGERIIDNIYKNPDIPYVQFGVHTFLATLYLARDERSKAEFHLGMAQKDFHQSDNYTDYLDDIRAYIQVYMDLEQYDEVTRILNYFIKKCEQDNASFFIYSMFMEKRIRCAAILKDQVGYLEYTKCFLESYWERGIYNLEAVVQAESAHNEHKRIMHMQKEITEQNEKLMIKSNHDALTGLPNRAYWHSYAEDALAKAIRNGTTFGVEILDIDFFKSVNDTYGHIDGDHYLVHVADALSSLVQENEDVFAARYGGDEVVLVYTGKTDEEICQMMAHLKSNMERIALPGTSPVGVDYITLSQGCCHCVPETKNRLWDYLATADKLLYQVKKDGKNNYKVGRWITE